jgi:putative redox protein
MPRIRFEAGSAESTFRGSADGFQVIVDRGEVGKPRSVDLLLLGLGSCTISTVNHYVRRKGLPIEQVAVVVAADLDEARNCYENIRVALLLGDAFSATDRKTLANVARTCRIHKTLVSQPEIAIEVGELTAADAD